MNARFFRNTFWAIGLLGMSFTSCTQEVEEVMPANKSVKMTVNVSREDFAGSRSVHQEAYGDMTTIWETGDKLLVTKTDGEPLGVINFVEATENGGLFEGDLYGLGNDGTYTLNYYYFGDRVTNPAQFDGNFSIASQDGTLESLSKYDVLSSTMEVTVDAGASHLDDIMLKRNFLIAHFNLEMPDGTTISGQPITISGTNVKNAVAFDLGANTFTTTDGPIVTGSTKGDFYVTLIPGDNVALNFSVTLNNVIYEGALDAVDLKRNMFVRTAHEVAVPVKMEKKRFLWENFKSTTITGAATLGQWVDSHDAVGANGKYYFTLGNETPAVDLNTEVSAFDKRGKTYWDTTNDPSKEGYHMATYAEWEGLRWISQNAGYGATYLTLNDTHYYIKTNSKGSNKIKIVFQECNDLGEKIGTEQTIEFGGGKSISVTFNSTSPWNAKSIREQNYARYWAAHYKCAYVDLSTNVGLMTPSVTNGSSKSIDWYGMRIRSIKNK